MKTNFIFGVLINTFQSITFWGGTWWDLVFFIGNRFICGLLEIKCLKQKSFRNAVLEVEQIWWAKFSFDERSWRPMFFFFIIMCTDATCTLWFVLIIAVISGLDCFCVRICVLPQCNRKEAFSSGPSLVFQCRKNICSWTVTSSSTQNICC